VIGDEQSLAEGHRGTAESQRTGADSDFTNFLTQVHYPGEVRVGTRALRLGRSSATLGQGLFVADHCFATAESVVVLINSEDGRSQAIPDPTRAALEAFLGPG